MYCKYCGKPLSDGARFCGFCGKDQESSSHILTKGDISIQSLIYTIVSYLTQATIIILSFKDVIKITFGEGYYKQSFLVNIFDMFDSSSYFRQLGGIVPDLMVLSDYAFTAGILIMISISVCIIYFLYVLILYIPNVNLKNRCVFGKEYHRYSVIPSFINSVIITTIIVVVGVRAIDVLTVIPSNKMIAIYFLLGFQLVINIAFRFNTSKVNNLVSNMEEEDFNDGENDIDDCEDDEDDFEEQLEKYGKHRVKVIRLIELVTIILIILIISIYYWSCIR